MLNEVLSLFTGWFDWPHWQSRIEVGLLFIAIYFFLSYLSGTRGERIIRALGFFLVVTLVGLVQIVRFLDLPNLEALLDAIISTLLIAFLIIFQPELRRGLIRLGSRNPFLERGVFGEKKLISALVATAVKCARNRVGVLLAIEGQAGLKTYVETGTPVDAAVSTALLSTIFFPGTALHDGAVIIRGSRIVAAGCLLPLTEATQLSSSLGTRHRAAVGLSEESDALVLVVSEETGIISIAQHGQIERRFDKESLTKRLTAVLSRGEDELEAEAEPAAAGAEL